MFLLCYGWLKVRIVPPWHESSGRTLDVTNMKDRVWFQAVRRHMRGSMAKITQSLDEAFIDFVSRKSLNIAINTTQITCNRICFCVVVVDVCEGRRVTLLFFHQIFSFGSSGKEEKMRAKPPMPKLLPSTWPGPLREMPSSAADSASGTVLTCGFMLVYYDIYIPVCWLIMLIVTSGCQWLQFCDDFSMRCSTKC